MENTEESNGRYRRRVRVVAAAGAASADMEDNPHRFGVDITHEHGRVTSIAGRAERTPWTTCPAAAGVLQELRDTPLLTSPFDVLRQVNQRLHCTHLLDMAALAIAAAARGRPHRLFDVALMVSPPSEAVDRRTGTLSVDGGAPEAWDLENGVIRGPTRYAGLELARASNWQAELAPSLDDKERVFVMRRAVLVSGGARYDLDTIATADEMDGMQGACFTFQPARAAKSQRRLGSGRTFSAAAALLEQGPGATPQD